MNTLTHPTKDEPSGGADKASRDSFGLNFNNPDIALDKIWHAIRIRWKVISAIVVTCLFIGLVITTMMTSMFTALTRIEISRDQNSVTNVEGVQSDDYLQTLEFYETQYALLQSFSLAERVVKTLNLAASPEFYEAMGMDLAEQGNVSRLDRNQRAARIRGAAVLLLNHLEILPVEKSSLVDIKFETASPSMSATIANEWVKQFVQSNLDRRFSSTSDARTFLESRLNELRIRLEESERKLVDYASSKAIVTLNPSEDSKSGRTLIATDLEAVNIELAKAKADRIAMQSKLASSESVSEESIDSPVISGLRQQSAKLVAERAALLSKFEEGYPTVQALTSEIRALENSIQSEQTRLSLSQQDNFRRAVAREKNLTSEVVQLKRDLNSQRKNEIQFNIYQREVDTNRELYEGLLQRYKEIGVAGVGKSNITIVDSAKIPGGPSSPSLPINLALALVAGLMLSAGYVFIEEQVDQSLKNPSDVEEMFDTALLGVIPMLDTDSLTEMLPDAKSTVSEAYFSAITSMSFLTAHGTPTTMVITSSRANEGKSTSAFAIATILAKTGRKVLLVDSDLRNPSQHLFAGLTNEAGLTNLLSGNEKIDGLIAQEVTKNLNLLTAGPIPPNTAELLSSDTFRSVISALTERFDHIIIDAPPVLSLADAPILANLVESVIFTVQANGAKIGAIENALNRLRAARGNIGGIIVTKADVRNFGYGDSYGYGYGYGKNNE